MRAHIRIFVATALLVCWVTGAAAEPMRRFVLAAGANNGGGDRVMLRYAATDAEEFSQVMLQMGLSLGWPTRWVVDWDDHQWVELRMSEGGGDRGGKKGGGKGGDNPPALQEVIKSR